jgi:hypothetical protein
MWPWLVETILVGFPVQEFVYFTVGVLDGHDGHMVATSFIP